MTSAAHELSTDGASTDEGTPRPEHPRPQLRRDHWLNLNGVWEYEADPGDSGLERGLLDRPLTGSILVPFAPESAASGVGTVDFLEAVWYRRWFGLPSAWPTGRVLLHFGAVDHDSTVWVNGVEAGRHRGGFTSFSFDVGELCEEGADNELVVRARDSRHGLQARGKQSTAYANEACYYTRTTGIWQTVWLEAVPQTYVRRVQVVPQVASPSFTLTADVSANARGSTLDVTVFDADGPVVRSRVRADLDLAPAVHLPIPDDRVRVWTPDDPHLYGLDLALEVPGEPPDVVHSYVGLRSIAIDGQALLLNGEPVFQRLVLDQGYWPETLMTAPSDAALRADIELARAAGFNGARLHQKVVEERYLYHADRLGHLVWAEFGDWGVAEQGPPGDDQRPTTSFAAEWLEAVRRDLNHPSIVGWCPLNETHQLLHDRTTVLDDVTRALFLATKTADPTRPVIDASGYSHRVAETDVYDSHDYEQDPSVFAGQQAGLADGRPFTNRPPGGSWSLAYAGQPYLVRSSAASGGTPTGCRAPAPTGTTPGATGSGCETRRSSTNASRP